MGSALEYRIAAGYLLALQLGVTAYLGRTAAVWTTGPSHSRARVLINGVWLGLMGLFVFVPDLLEFWAFEMFVAVRWSLTIPATAAILLLVWTLRSRFGNFEPEGFVAEGPYRLSRFPLDAANAAFIFSAGLFTSNYLIMAASILATLLLRLGVPREMDRARLGHFGEDYRAYAARTGCFLPVMESHARPQYTVPRRFGLTAILGLLTILALIFGALKYTDAKPPVYVFIVCEIVAICLSQIFFGGAPRLSSMLTGAVLLPVWVYFTLSSPPGMTVALHLILGICLAAVGGLLGYCIGTLAAGYFLVLDLIEPLLYGNSSHDHQPGGTDETLPNDG